MQAALTSPSLPGTRGRVLLVEDDPDSGEALCELLSFVGYDCQWTPSHDAAFVRLRDAVPSDLLILDLDPHHECESVRLVQRARSAGVRMPPILIFSALGADSLRGALREIGAQGLLRKPSGCDALCDAIEAAMAARQPLLPGAITPH